jgi:hypothetical protein
MSNKLPLLTQLKQFSLMNVGFWLTGLTLIYIFVDVIGIPAWLYVIIYSPFSYLIKFYLYRNRVFSDGKD